MKLESDRFLLPDIVKTYIQRGVPSFNNKASPQEPLAHKRQTFLHSAVARLLDTPMLGESKSSFSTSQETLQISKNEVLTLERTLTNPRYSSETLDALGLEDLTEALKQNPTLLDARLARAELHVAGGNYAFAFTDFDVVLKIAPLCTKARLNRGVLLLQLRRNIEARADLDEAISVLDIQRPAGDISQIPFDNQPERLILALALYLRRQCLPMLRVDDKIAQTKVRSCHLLCCCIRFWERKFRFLTNC